MVRFLIQSFAAMYKSPATATPTDHKLLSNQFTIFPAEDNNQDTIDPITACNAAVALPARFARNLPRLVNCFLSIL